ncbi:MAG TPA: anti-sigma factor [Steroidobacteraceae bacterium]|nr:anti-sigma factor [Steroidobacteraceae bacterium]
MNNDRLVELLVQRATEGLSANEQVELNRLLAQGNYTDADQFEVTAAALMLASAPEDEPLPDALRNRLEQQADAFIATAPASVTPLTAKAAVPPRPASKIPWFAAAACAVFALAGWWPRENEREPDILSQASADMETVARARERLLAQSTVMQREWKPTEDPAAQGVTGDVVWDAQAQVGYMRFRGLPMNNPQEMQYQLWIFDATRGDKYPVDGGVFNIPPNSEGEVIVPILAKLPVRDPALFAVTAEKPGGVVVSERERILVLAQAKSG